MHFLPSKFLNGKLPPYGANKLEKTEREMSQSENNVQMRYFVIS